MRAEREGSPHKEAGPLAKGPANVVSGYLTTADEPKSNLTGDQLTSSSQQASWWSVHEHVAPFLAAVGAWPMAGTPEWCGLDDDDPVKIAALFDAARHWALRLETCQQAHCDASCEVSAAVDWSALAREIYQRNSFYAARPWLRRAAS